VISLHIPERLEDQVPVALLVRKPLVNTKSKKETTENRKFQVVGENTSNRE